VSAPLVALPSFLVRPLVDAALREDFGLGGDLTSEATIPSGLRARGSFVAREPGTLAGIGFVAATFAALDSRALVEAKAADGDRFAAGALLATVDADARALLGGERTALNLLSHLSGIATATAAYVAAVAAAGVRTAICETRKTLPGLRAIQKYAVRAGGGANHRFRLDDAVLIKDNHVALAGGIGPALRGARARAGHLVRVEIEVDSLAQLDEVLATGGADVVLLDNFSPADVAVAVARTASRLVVEVSGGVNLATVGAYAAAGPDVISVGELTHSVRALDIGLDVEARA